MLHIYYGNGKGKTCSAIGAAIRAAGRGMNILFVQLFKCGDTGERAILSHISGIELYPCPSSLKFTFDMDSEELAQERERYRRTLAYIKEKRDEYDVIVIDEFFTLADSGLADRDSLYKYVCELNSGRAEIILTGHGVDTRFTDLAAYATEFRCVSHPYDCGTPPRTGIEM